MEQRKEAITGEDLQNNIVYYRTEHVEKNLMGGRYFSNKGENKSSLKTIELFIYDDVL